MMIPQLKVAASSYVITADERREIEIRQTKFDDPATGKVVAFLLRQLDNERNSAQAKLISLHSWLTEEINSTAAKRSNEGL